MEPINEKKIFVFVRLLRGLLVLLAVFVVLSLWYGLTAPTSLQKEERQNNKALTPEVVEKQKEVVTPPPLRTTPPTSTKPPSVSEPQALSRSEVVRFTNRERKNNNLAALSENIKLNTAAERKLQDMFTRQYFAHKSPQGYSVDHWVDGVGYEYVTVGENLALGDFVSSQALVEAWMGSPGHRANILNSRYQDIGVAVKKGQFEGVTTWFAVQIFAKPLVSCPPEPSKSLQSSIEKNNATLLVLQQQIDEKRAELEQLKSGPKEEYNKKADEYNALVKEYNGLVAATKTLVEKYNAQVRAFNACVQST